MQTESHTNDTTTGTPVTELFFEGIGIRQILDYYFVTMQEVTEEERKEHARLLKSFGLHKFTTAATYVMQHIFNLDESRRKHRVKTKKLKTR